MNSFGVKEFLTDNLHVLFPIYSYNFNLLFDGKMQTYWFLMVDAYAANFRLWFENFHTFSLVWIQIVKAVSSVNNEDFISLLVIVKEVDYGAFPFIPPNGSKAIHDIVDNDVIPNK